MNGQTFGGRSNEKMIMAGKDKKSTGSTEPAYASGSMAHSPSWIAGLSAFTDMNESEELQASSVTRQDS